MQIPKKKEPPMKATQSISNCCRKRKEDGGNATTPPLTINAHSNGAFSVYRGQCRVASFLSFNRAYQFAMERDSNKEITQGSGYVSA